MSEILGLEERENRLLLKYTDRLSSWVRLPVIRNSMLDAI